MAPTEIADLVMRLRADNLKRELGDNLSHEAADLILSLQSRITELERQAALVHGVTREECAKAAENAKLPPDFQWGSEAMEQFDYGKERAATAIRALSPTVDLDAMMERGAEALFEAYRTDECHPAAIPLKWAELTEELKRLPRLQATAVLRALGMG